MKSNRAQYWYRLLLIALFLIPLAYVGEILAVAVHEVLGHGLAALCLGGEFMGFTLNWDGMGWAHAYPRPNAPAWHEIVILACGVAVTILWGILFLILALLLRKRLFLRLFMLVLSIMFLLGNTSYLFWNAYHPVPPGDIGQILINANNTFLRPLVMVLGGSLMVAAILLLNALLFQGVEEWIGRGERLAGRKKLFALIVLIAMPGVVGWFAFDWNQLAPGLGRLPCIVGAICQLATAVGLYWYSLDVKGRPRHLGQVKWPMLFVWVFTAIILLAMRLWLTQGVYFSTEYASGGAESAPAIQLTPPSVDDMALLCPSFSPDGTILACTLQAGDYAAPMLLDSPSFKPRPLARLLGMVEGVSGFSWRPDGKEFVFTFIEADSAGRIVGFAVWLFDVQLNTARPLARPTAEQLFEYPLFAPNGNSVLFRDALGHDLLVCDNATGKTRRLTNFGSTFWWGYAWSADSNFVLTSTGYLGGGSPGLWRVSATEDSVQQINSIAGISKFKASPDGKTLACLIRDESGEEEEQGYQLTLINIVSGKHWDLARTDDIAMAWSPDGKIIAYVKNARIWTYDLVADVSLVWTPADINAGYPFWNPTDNTLWCVINERKIARLLPEGFTTVFSLDEVDPTKQLEKEEK